MKKTITICVTVILCVAMMCGSFIYVGKGFNESIGNLIPAVFTSTTTGDDAKELPTTTAAETETTVEDVTEPETEEETTEAEEETTVESAAATATAQATTTQKTTTKAAATTKATATTKKATTTTTKKATTTTTKKVTTTTKAQTTTAANLSTAQIISNYNAAVNKVRSSNAGYTKTRSTTLNKIDAGAFGNMSTVKDAVSGFLGVGDKTYTNTKGKNEFMSAADLKAADVKSASYTLKNGKYTYTLELNTGSSSADSSNNSNSSPVDRTGILVGTGDKTAYDHKNASNLYTAINNTDGASVKSVSESTSNVKCVAVVNASDGKLESLTVSFDFSVTLTNTKYVITIKSAGGTASTTVKFTDFKF